MRNFKEYLIKEGSSIKDALKQLNTLASDAILFIVTESNKLIGSLTDGDVRRGLLNGLSMNHQVDDFLQPKPKFIEHENYKLSDILELRDKKITIIPVLNSAHEVIDVVNFKYFKSYLPIEAVIMAGGKGSRLMPLTEKTPKPLLKVGNKEIVSYNFDWLYKYGINKQHITVNYLGDQIRNFCNEYKSNIEFNVVEESNFMGTAGSLSLINDFSKDYILLMNSDLLTNVDYEDLFNTFIKQNSDMIVASIAHLVDLPYAIFQTKNEQIMSFEEKPTYTYYANAGIYLFKKKLLKFIPKDKVYNATDFMQDVRDAGYKLTHFPINDYWLDIGKYKDFDKAQEDVKHINF